MAGFAGAGPVLTSWAGFIGAESVITSLPVLLADAVPNRGVADKRFQRLSSSWPLFRDGYRCPAGFGAATIPTALRL